MIIYGKSLKEYSVSAKVFLLVTLAITLVQVALFLLKVLPLTSIYTNLIGLLKLFLFAWAGWFLVKKYDFELKQVFFAGCLFFIITSLWVLLFLLDVFTVIGLIWLGALNFTIIVIITLFGGWLAKKFARK